VQSLYPDEDDDTATGRMRGSDPDRCEAKAASCLVGMCRSTFVDVSNRIERGSELHVETGIEVRVHGMTSQKPGNGLRVDRMLEEALRVLRADKYGASREKRGVAPGFSRTP
jgi:hypothetical protein